MQPAPIAPKSLMQTSISRKTVRAPDDTKTVHAPDDRKKPSLDGPRLPARATPQKSGR